MSSDLKLEQHQNLLCGTVNILQAVLHPLAKSDLKVASICSTTYSICSLISTGYTMMNNLDHKFDSLPTVAKWVVITGVIIVGIKAGGILFVITRQYDPVGLAFKEVFMPSLSVCLAISSTYYMAYNSKKLSIYNTADTVNGFLTASDFGCIDKPLKPTPLNAVVECARVGTMVSMGVARIADI